MRTRLNVRQKDLTVLCDTNTVYSSDRMVWLHETNILGNGSDRKPSRWTQLTKQTWQWKLKRHKITTSAFHGRFHHSSNKLSTHKFACHFISIIHDMLQYHFKITWLLTMHFNSECTTNRSIAGLFKKTFTVI